MIEVIIFAWIFAIVIVAYACIKTMKMRKIINIFIPYAGDIILSFIVNVAETAYFGWNMEATCRAEEIWDVACTFGYIFAFVLLTIDIHDSILNMKEKQ